MNHWKLTCACTYYYIATTLCPICVVHWFPSSLALFYHPLAVIVCFYTYIWFRNKSRPSGCWRPNPRAQVPAVDHPQIVFHSSD